MSKMSLPVGMLNSALPHSHAGGRFEREADFADALISDRAPSSPFPEQKQEIPAGNPAAVPPRASSGGPSTLPSAAQMEAPTVATSGWAGLAVRFIASPTVEVSRLAKVAPLNVLPATLYPGVPVWSRVYPQHWFANGYLSIIDVLACNVSAPAHCTPLVSGSDPERNGPISLRASEAADAVGSISETSVPTPTFAPETSAPAPDDDSPAPSWHALALAMAVNHVWAERLVRLTRDSHGISTVWLRDYSLNESAIEPVVEAVRRQAYREGVVIDRVMVNGREVWRAALPQGRK